MDKVQIFPQSIPTGYLNWYPLCYDYLLPSPLLSYRWCAKHTAISVGMILTRFSPTTGDALHLFAGVRGRVLKRHLTHAHIKCQLKSYFHLLHFSGTSPSPLTPRTQGPQLQASPINTSKNYSHATSGRASRICRLSCHLFPVFRWFSLRFFFFVLSPWLA